jgi:hypothetical protein
MKVEKKVGGGGVGKKSSVLEKLWKKNGEMVGNK